MSKRGTRPTRSELAAGVRAKWAAHVAAWQRDDLGLALLDAQGVEILRFGKVD
jgi:hypothetical protein